MRDRFLALWRTAAQAGLAMLLLVLANHGVHVPDTVQGWILAALIGFGAGLWAYGTHWLQSRQGNDWRARACRVIGRILVLGAGALPTYDTPAAPPVGAHTAGS